MLLDLVAEARGGGIRGTITEHKAGLIHRCQVEPRA